MPPKPASSLIIPAYNSSASIGRSIDSALEQTVPAHEIIVIDDGSTDDTADIIRSYGSKVRLITQDNQGQGAARNAGLAVATGRYIAFLDADDYWEPGFLEHMERFLDAHPQAVAASCAFHAQRQKGDYYGPAHYEQLKAQHPDGLMLEDFFTFWADHDHIRTGTALVRHDVIREIGPQNANLRISQDLEYWALIGSAGPWGLVPEVLWVGTSDFFARRAGWRKRNAARRKRTPSVEAWQARVLPRLSPEQVAPFARVRARVAQGYAVNHMLGGDASEARKIVQAYGAEMSGALTPRLMRLGNRFGWLGWQVVVQALRVYDRIK